MYLYVKLNNYIKWNILIKFTNKNIYFNLEKFTTDFFKEYFHSHVILLSNKLIKTRVFEINSTS